MAWSLKGFLKALKEVDATILEFHLGKGDFESWMRCSLKDEKLADEIAGFKGLKGEKLSKELVSAVKKRFAVQTTKVQDAAQLS